MHFQLHKAHFYIYIHFQLPRMHFYIYTLPLLQLDLMSC